MHRALGEILPPLSLTYGCLERRKERMKRIFYSHRCLCGFAAFSDLLVPSKANLLLMQAVPPSADDTRESLLVQIIKLFLTHRLGLPLPS